MPKALHLLKYGSRLPAIISICNLQSLTETNGYTHFEENLTGKLF